MSEKNINRKIAVILVAYVVRYSKHMQTEENSTPKAYSKCEQVLKHISDVFSRAGNLLGDGVNIAAGLEALLQPNSVYISKSIFDLVIPKTKMTFNDLDIQKVHKNQMHACDILLKSSQKRKLKFSKKAIVLL